MSERRLSDLVSVGVLTRTFPPEVVDAVVAEAGRTEQRNRSLPARVMAYFAIGMALHSEGSYEDVLGLLTDGLAWTEPGVEPVKLPSKSAIFQARRGWGPSRCVPCSSGSRRRWQSRDCPVVGWRAGAWSRSMGPRSTSLTPTPTLSGSVDRA